MRKKKVNINYCPLLANNLEGMAKELDIPYKVIRLWRESWLSSPVSPEDFRTLAIISEHVWASDQLIKIQLARRSRASRLTLALDAGHSKPESFLRKIVLRKMLEGKRVPPSKRLIATVRSWYPNGYLLIKAKTIRAAKAWASDEMQRAAQDDAYRQILLKSAYAKVGADDHY
jgi:hypothetical protein